MVIIIGGMIGMGKTTTASILEKELSLPVYYESVSGNKFLPLFYNATKEEEEKYRYPFLLQMNFLSTRFDSIQEALTNDQAILDRSIYEDHYFAHINHQLGRISDLEMETYESILNGMMNAIDKLPKKGPDLMIYLKGSFETCLSRIQSRGRSFEIDPDLKAYYYTLWKDYDEWIYSHYKASPIPTLDVDQIDILNNREDLDAFLSQIKEILG